MVAAQRNKCAREPFTATRACFISDSLSITNYTCDDTPLDFSQRSAAKRSKRSAIVKPVRGTKQKQSIITRSGAKELYSIFTQCQSRQVSDMIADALADSQESQTDDSQNDLFNISGGSRHTMDAPSETPSGGMGRASRADPINRTSPAELPVQPELEYLRDLAGRLNAQIDILEQEVSKHERASKKQKLKIKNLTNQVDSLRKTHSGTRKMLSKRSVAINTVRQEKEQTHSDELKLAQEALEVAQVKLESFKSEIKMATSNMFSALSDDSPDPSCDIPNQAPSSDSTPDSPRQKNSRKLKKSRGTPVNVKVNFTQSGRSDINMNNNNTHRRDTTPTTHTDTAAGHNTDAPPRSRPPGHDFPPPPYNNVAPPTSSHGQGIYPPQSRSPGYDFPPPPTNDIPSSDRINESYADFVRNNPKPTKLVFGSSLAQGSQEALKHKGVNVWEYYFSSAEIPFIRLHIQRILEANPQVTHVVLLFGGNDCENFRHHIDEIRHQYDLTIELIKKVLGRDCCIIMCSIPQRRRCSIDTHLKIATLNKHLWARHDPSENLHYLDAAPRFAFQFRDRVHLNYLGMRDWADAVTARINFIANFQSSVSNTTQ